jgi:hypothetical protein
MRRCATILPVLLDCRVFGVWRRSGMLKNWLNCGRACDHALKTAPILQFLNQDQLFGARHDPHDPDREIYYGTRG